MQPKKWNSPVCTNLKITLIKSNFIRSIDVSETIPNLNSAKNESGGTNKVAYSSIRCVFGEAIVTEIVVYKKWPRSMRLDFLGHRTLFWLPTLFWKPKKWNSPICTNLKITLIKRSFIRSLYVSETIPNLNSAVNESGGTNKVAYSGIRCVFGEAIVTEIVVYKKWPRSMRLDSLGHRTLFRLPTLFWIKDKEPDSAHHFRQVVNNSHKGVRAW